MPLKLVERKGSDFYYIRGTVRGQSIFESTGTRDREVAEAIRIQTESRLLNESVHGKKALITFEEAAQSYIASGGSERFLIKVSPATGKVSGIVTYFRGKLLKDLTQSDLDAAARILFPTASAETRNRQCYTPFIAVWNHAAGNQWAEVRQWKRPRKAKGTNVVKLKVRAGTKPTSYDRAAEFVAAMSPAPAQLMTALFYTGMRPIEIFTLEAPEVNVQGRWITLDRSKTGEARGVPIHEFLVPLFEALVARGGILFRSHKGEPYPPTEEFGGQLSSAIKGARNRLKKAGVTIFDIAPYTGRHTVSTQLVVNGIHPYIKDQILGHAADDMSRHYTHVPQQPLIEAINTLPVPQLWREQEWWSDPVYWSRKLVKWGDPAKRREQKAG
ncbi:integrase [Ensifer sp. Root142]|uniref:tyrosine-type recombinase/integrase n=1 Tax=Ensifer sp. Root142 TaxID=1736461 RepID=UPI00070F3D54|nr:site-specific integrase [Ensifer sp. Root142]KQY71322.1 integrase [Ensifer sp. Root142]